MPTQTELILQQLSELQQFNQSLVTNKKEIHQFPTATELNGANYFPVSVGGVTQKTTLTQLSAYINANNLLRQNSYEDLQDMFDNQSEQTEGKVQYVDDARTATEIDDEVEAYYAYFEKLDSSFGVLSDYRRLSADEVLVVQQVVNYREFVVKQVTTSTLPNATGVNYIDFKYDAGDGNKLRQVLFNFQFSNYLLADKTDFDNGIAKRLKFFNKSTGFQMIGVITAMTITASDCVLVTFTTPATNADVIVGHTLEVFVDDDTSSGGGSSGNLSILDFVTDAPTKAKILANDDSQDSAIVKTAFDDAFDYCKTNGIKMLDVPSGTYIPNKVTVNNLSNFYLRGHGAVLKPATGNAIFEFTSCVRWGISGFNATSNAVAYADVSFFNVSTGSGWFNFLDCHFTNMPRCGIRASGLVGGTFTKGIQVSFCTFADTANFSNVNQCGIELGNDGEYSKISHNMFQAIPSAVRMVDGANSEFSYNTCMEMNGTAYTTSYLNGIVYCVSSSNSGKIDIIGNKFNHNDTGIIAIVCKGDPTKTHNAFKIIGNDVLVNTSSTKTLSIYLEDAPFTIIEQNKLRGNQTTPNDTAIRLKNSNKVVIDSNYIKYYDNFLTLETSEKVKLGNKNIIENLDLAPVVFDSTSSNFDCEQFSFSISGVGSAVTISDTSPKFMPFDAYVLSYFITAGVVPTGSALTVGFKINGSSAVSTGASIDATEETSLTGTSPVLSSYTLSRGDKIMFPITAIGSTIAGQDVTVYMQILKR